MTSKPCFKCRETKPLSEFYRHKMMGDGHLNKCKACARADVTRNREAKADYYRAYDRVRYYEHGHRSASKPDAGKARTYSIRWRDRNREKRKAHEILNHALQTGKIKRPRACQKCRQRGEVQAHHHDYTKPLDVHWLCRPCHGLEHRMSEKEARAILARGPTAD